MYDKCNNYYSLFVQKGRDRCDQASFSVLTV